MRCRRCSFSSRSRVHRHTPSRQVSLASLLELMAGHPRFLEMLLFVLGRPDSKTGVDEWCPAQFVASIAALVSPSGERVSLQPWLVQLRLAVQLRYGAFQSYLNEPRFFALVPQLLGHTLFEWSVHRQQSFREGDYECTVQTMEENGVVFLTPKQPVRAPHANVSSTSTSTSSSTATSSAALPLADTSPSLRLVVPFLWLLLLSERYEAGNASTVPCLPLVSSTQCILSPAQNEQLTMSVLSLKCMCFCKMGRATVSVRELLGVDVVGCNVPICLPPSGTPWMVEKLRHAVTTAEWSKWLANTRDGDPAVAAAVSPARFFINAEKASSWDGCALTTPAVCVQDKQGLVSRERVASGKAAKPVAWAKVKEEINKCQMIDRGGQSLLLYCTDGVVADRPEHLPERVAIIDEPSHAVFFGPILAHRRAMCLSEVPTSPTHTHALTSH